MTTVAITRDTLCADRMGTITGMAFPVRKVHHAMGEKLGEFVAALCGCEDTGMAMLHWLRGDMDPSQFPVRQVGEDWCRIIVLTRSGDRLTFEKTPYPIRIEGDWRTFGAGQDFAAAALDLGHLPGEAIMCAGRLNVWTGHGVEGFTLTPGGFDYWSIEP